MPALYAEAGTDLVEGGTERGERLQADYIENRYHKPSDEYDPSWDLSGMAQALRLFQQVGEKIADSDDWPRWYEGNERHPRPRMRAGRRKTGVGRRNWLRACR